VLPVTSPGLPNLLLLSYNWWEIPLDNHYRNEVDELLFNSIEKIVAETLEILFHIPLTFTITSETKSIIAR
jgi:hypothetical protein